MVNPYIYINDEMRGRAGAGPVVVGPARQSIGFPMGIASPARRQDFISRGVSSSCQLLFFWREREERRRET